jgi:hypothetical protein
MKINFNTLNLIFKTRSTIKICIAEREAEHSEEKTCIHPDLFVEKLKNLYRKIGKHNKLQRKQAKYLDNYLLSRGNNTICRMATLISCFLSVENSYY